MTVFIFFKSYCNIIILLSFYYKYEKYKIIFLLFLIYSNVSYHMNIVKNQNYTNLILH